MEHFRAFGGALQVSIGALHAKGVMCTKFKGFMDATPAGPQHEHREQTLHSPSFASENWTEVWQSVQLPSFLYGLPGLQAQLLGEAEPSSAVLPFGQGVHSSEVSEKLSLKVFAGHFVHVAPVPFLRCSHWLGKES